jgi:hypothetical protein
MMGTYKFLGFDLFKKRFGLEFSRVHAEGKPYLDRYIAYVGFGTLRLHKFYRGDDDRAPHDHPWTFWTMPLTDYWERVWDEDNGRYIGRQVVKAWRLHKRPAKYRHIVEGRADRKVGPFWTFVVTTDRLRSWGFWPAPHKFIYWRDWDAVENHTNRE